MPWRESKVFQVRHFATSCGEGLHFCWWIRILFNTKLAVVCGNCHAKSQHDSFRRLDIMRQFQTDTHNKKRKPNCYHGGVYVCCVGSCSVPGASVNQPGTTDASGERISGFVHTVLHAQGSYAASSSAEPVRRRTLQGRHTDLGNFAGQKTDIFVNDYGVNCQLCYSIFCYSLYYCRNILY